MVQSAPLAQAPAEKSLDLARGGVVHSRAIARGTFGWQMHLTRLVGSTNRGMLTQPGRGDVTRDDWTPRFGRFGTRSRTRRCSPTHRVSLLLRTEGTLGGLALDTALKRCEWCGGSHTHTGAGYERARREGPVANDGGPVISIGCQWVVP